MCPCHAHIKIIDNEFCVVTLASVDGQKLKAHKVIFSASSIFFKKLLMNNLYDHPLKTRRGSPVNRRPPTAEAPPIGQIYAFSKMAVTFEPMMQFGALLEIVYFITGTAISNRLGMAAA